MANRTTYTEWRIETKRPRERWGYTSFSGSVDRNERRIRDLLARECARAEKPGGIAGWQFRLASRTVTITHSPWTVDESR